MKNFYQKTLLIVLFILLFCVFPVSGNDINHLYIDQSIGTNTSNTTGSETDPFKSITYAFMKKKNMPDPWFVHIKAGVYDANPEKPVTEREIFPIYLRNEITIIGDDGAENCHISGLFNTDSNSSIFLGQNLTNILIMNLTISDMKRNNGSGGGCELIECTGRIEGCVFDRNESSSYNDGGGGLYLKLIDDNSKFDLINNTFSNNTSIPRGGGVTIYGHLISDITGNSFVGNTGGGLFISDGMTGNLSNNTFHGNNRNISLYNGSGAGVNISGQFTGNIHNNSFLKNISSTNGGAMYLSSINGNIFNNLFIKNIAAYANGSGFYIESDSSGKFSNNVFSGNYSTYSQGGGFYCAALLNGSIDSNIFSQNSNCSFCLAGVSYSTEQLITIANNFFLYNHNNSNESNIYSGFNTSQHALIINNTFYGGNIDESFVRIYSLAGETVIKNNIFSDIGNAIWLESELDLTIANNNFFNVNNILLRNNQDMGTDLEFIGMFLLNFKNNIVASPGIIGENIEILSQNKEIAYDSLRNITIVTDTTKNWISNQWKGAMLKLSTQSESIIHCPILSNTATELFLAGNLTGIMPIEVNYSYTIDDYRLAKDSSNIDSGIATNITVDYENDIRPIGTGWDIGADEFSEQNIQNQKPIALEQSLITDEDTPLKIMLTGADENEDPLIYIVTKNPSHGFLSGNAPLIQYIPTSNYHGFDSFGFKVNDGELDSETVEINININSINDPPIANAQTLTTNEDTPVNITLEGSDIENDNLTFKLITQPSNGSINGLPPDITYTPKADHFGTDSFTFKTNDGKADSNEAKAIVITINPLNDKPIAIDQNINTEEGQKISINLTGTDVDNDQLTFELKSTPLLGTLSGSKPNFQYTPDSNVYGRDELTYQVFDGQLYSDTAKVTITINPIDSDNDGVIDLWDQCDNTPFGVAVNKNGCLISTGCDMNGDNKIGLEEAIHTLRQVSGFGSQ